MKQFIASLVFIMLLATSVLAATGVAVFQDPTGQNPCYNPSSTLLSTTAQTSGTAAAQIVGLSGSTKIYICSMSVIGVSGTTPTFSLVDGTGSNCASNQAAIVAAFTPTAGVIYNFDSPVAVLPAGYALCYLQTGTTPIASYVITYIQQ